MSRSLYFLPGTMCDEQLWQPVWEQLPADLSKHFISLDRGNSFEELEAHVLQSLPPDPVHLVAFSMGGYVAQRLALAHPTRIQSLTLLASSAKGLKKAELHMREHTLQYLKEATYNGIAMARIRQLVHPNHIKPAVMEAIKAMDKRLGKAVLIAQLEATSKRISLMHRLEEFNFPVFLIGSSDDTLVPQTDLLEMYQYLDDGKLLFLEECGHMIPLEKPQEVAHALMDWLSIVD
ncbi:MAG: alpha/beta fold hydrolase [Flammeovirgaceae bacterium]